jgi:hypothetical protein
MPEEKMMSKLDPFADPEIAEEMRQMVGVRFVCATVGCDWFGNSFVEDELCPKCGHMPVDRWAAHVRAIIRTYEG